MAEVYNSTEILNLTQQLGLMDPKSYVVWWMLDSKKNIVIENTC